MSAAGNEIGASYFVRAHTPRKSLLCARSVARWKGHRGSHRDERIAVKIEKYHNTRDARARRRTCRCAVSSRRVDDYWPDPPQSCRRRVLLVYSPRAAGEMPTDRPP